MSTQVIPNIKWAGEMNTGLATLLIKDYHKWDTAKSAQHKVDLCRGWAKQLGLGESDVDGKRTRRHLKTLLGDFRLAHEIMKDETVVAPDGSLQVKPATMEYVHKSCEVYDILAPVFVKVLFGKKFQNVTIVEPSEDDELDEDETQSDDEEEDTGDNHRLNSHGKDGAESVENQGSGNKRKGSLDNDDAENRGNHGGPSTSDSKEPATKRPRLSYDTDRAGVPDHESKPSVKYQSVQLQREQVALELAKVQLEHRRLDVKLEIARMKLNPKVTQHRLQEPELSELQTGATVGHPLGGSEKASLGIAASRQNEFANGTKFDNPSTSGGSRSLGGKEVARAPTDDMKAINEQIIMEATGEKTLPKMGDATHGGITESTNVKTLGAASDATKVNVVEVEGDQSHIDSACDPIRTSRRF